MRDVFHSFLEERGVNESLFPFLQAWIYVKDHRNLLRWFKSVGTYVHENPSAENNAQGVAQSEGRIFLSVFWQFYAVFLSQAVASSICLIWCLPCVKVGLRSFFFFFFVYAMNLVEYLSVQTVLAFILLWIYIIQPLYLTDV